MFSDYEISGIQMQIVDVTTVAALMSTVLLAR